MPGVELEGKVIRLQDQGVVVDLGDDIEGFVPASHAAIDNADRLPEYYGTGDTVDLKVIESDAANRRIVLEVTTAPERNAARAAELEAAAKEAEANGEAPEGTSEPTASSDDAPEAMADEEDTKAGGADEEEAAPDGDDEEETDED
jgi:ribosomal protein S1